MGYLSSLFTVNLQTFTIIKQLELTFSHCIPYTYIYICVKKTYYISHKINKNAKINHGILCLLTKWPNTWAGANFS